MDEEVEKRLEEGITKLRPQDWKSGEIPWVVEVIAPFGGAVEMVIELQEKVFDGHKVRFNAANQREGTR